MATQAERRAETRSRLLQAAEEAFLARGYEAATTGAILEAAGVSRGGLYHHFANKREIFEAVFLAKSDAALDASQRVKPCDSPLESLVRACLAWLRAVRAPDVAKVLLEDGPSVLGWQRARELEGERSLRMMTRALEAAVMAGEIEVASIPVTARLLNASLAEAALAELHDGVSRRATETSVRAWIEALARA
ncbi:MAG: helix-turn-helix domain-containing protein [Myxococcota bacterium]